MVINENAYDFADEFFVVEKTVEVRVRIEGIPQTVRIEALLHPASGSYYARACIQDCFKIQPSYPQSRGRFDREPLDGILWLDFEIPWAAGDSADDAITQALGVLRLQCG